MKHRVSTVKVGLLAIISLSALIFVLIWLRGRGIQAGEPFEVYFQDVDGMREAAPVQMMGIRVGFVDAIEPLVRHRRYCVRVRFSVIDESVRIPKGATLSIEQSGIIGEKFLEITPPPLREAMVEAPSAALPAAGPDKSRPPAPLATPLPVMFDYAEGRQAVGVVERAYAIAAAPGSSLGPRHQVYFRVSRPGAVMPANPVYTLLTTGVGAPCLLIRARGDQLAHAPDPALFFTIQNPMRIKEFLDIQMESAEALKLTNEKVAKLLSEETIATLNSTIKNTETLTARATVAIEAANSLFALAHKDLQHLVATTEQLAGNLLVVSNNVNQVIGDPQLKQDVLSTVSSIRQSSAALNELLRDPALSQTLTLAHGTMKDTAELAALLKKTAHDPVLQQRLDTSLTHLNVSLDKLSSILLQLETLTQKDHDPSLQKMLEDVQESTTNLRQFSTKLKGRFVLFKLMF